MPSTRQVLKGSRRAAALPGAMRRHPAGAAVEVTLKLRPKARTRTISERLENLRRSPPDERRYLTRKEHERILGARPSDICTVDAFAKRYRLKVLDRNAAKRAVRLRGRAADIERAFGIRLQSLSGNRRIHAHTGMVSLPRGLRPVVRAVFGLDTRPVVRAHALGAPAGLSPFDVCRSYGFPDHLSGSGQWLAVIELNGHNNLGAIGTGFAPDDLAHFFPAGAGAPPTVVAVPGPNGAGNLPGIYDAGDKETALDIQVAAAAAPGASIAVYFGVQGEQGYHDAVAAAVHDSARNPRVISISWGNAEGNYSANFMSEMNALFEEAGALGITVCVSSGDLGSAGSNPASDVPQPNFPATSPAVLACGGTTAEFQNGVIAVEAVWNGGFASGAGGGGVSEVFPLPDWQKSCGIPVSAQKKWAGRGIPDLAAHADQAQGYGIVCKGSPASLGGTSAVAPLIAGLVTRINQGRAAAGKGPVGFINPVLYAHPSAFRAVVGGTNDIDGSLGAYSATAGWNACAGLGAPLCGVLLPLLS